MFMSRDTVFSISFLVLVLLASAVAFENKLFSGAIIIYWAGFMGLLGFALKKSYDMHKMVQNTALARAQGEAGVWLAPISRKVQWSAEEKCESEKLLGYWQGESVFEKWIENNEKWVWHRNTVKDIWPKDEPLADGIKWWKGVAIYKKEPLEKEKLLVEENAAKQS
jgi:hypothetical protein